jgi:hypothetical protein
MMANGEPISELEMIWKEMVMSTNTVIFLEGLKKTMNASLAVTAATACSPSHS